MSIQLATLQGGTTEIADTDLQALRGGFKGSLLAPGDAGYDEARSLWNAMIDRRPGLIARCSGTADVLHAVRFARTHGLLNSVRGGGHNIAGLRRRVDDRPVGHARHLGGRRRRHRARPGRLHPG